MVALEFGGCVGCTVVGEILGSEMVGVRGEFD